MKKLIMLTSIIFGALILFSFTSETSKFVSSNIHVKFFSTTPAEDIEANNFSAVSTLNPETGDVVFSVPMQSFEFEKAMMQKHFNSNKFLDTKQFPKGKLTGSITNLDEITFGNNGSYTANIEGEMTIKGVSKPFTANGDIIVTDSKIEVKSTFNLTLQDYGITFIKGKPAANIAKTVEVTILAEYLQE